ncbi:MAG: hypothetical protein ACLFTQ_02460 [Candidatus Aenigmatarchaeota archaeon]
MIEEKYEGRNIPSSTDGRNGPVFNVHHEVARNMKEYKNGNLK